MTGVFNMNHPFQVVLIIEILSAVDDHSSPDENVASSNMTL